MHVSMARDHVGLVSFGTQGYANLTPTYRYLNGQYYCYKASGSNSGWRTRTLNGYYYDWTGMYGVNPSSNDVSSSSFRWVYNDNSWDMTDMDHTNYWPYTINYDTGETTRTMSPCIILETVRTTTTMQKSSRCFRRMHH